MVELMLKGIELAAPDTEEIVEYFETEFSRIISTPRTYDWNVLKDFKVRHVAILTHNTDHFHQACL